MGWLDRMRGRGDEPRSQGGCVAVIGLDGVGLPLVQDLVARGVMPALGEFMTRGTAAPMRSSKPVAP